MAGISSLHCDPVRINAHLTSLLNQMIVQLKDGKDIQARQLFESAVSPYAGELFDEGVICKLSNALFSPLNFTGVEKANAIAKVAKASIPGFTSSFDSPKPALRPITVDSEPDVVKKPSAHPLSLDIAVVKSGGKKQYRKSPMPLSLRLKQDEYIAPSSGESSPVVQRRGHKSLDNSPVELVDPSTVPVWNFGAFAPRNIAPAAEDENDPDLAQAIALSLAEHATDGNAAIDEGKAPA